MPKPTVAVIVGSNRKESINRKYAQALVKLGADKFDAHFARIDDLPMYNQDNEANPGPEVLRFKDEISKADGVLIVTPEHDRSMPAALNNAVALGRAAVRQERMARQGRLHHRHHAGRARHRAGAGASALGDARARHDAARRRGLCQFQAEPVRRSGQYRRRDHAEIPAGICRPLCDAGQQASSGKA